MMKLRDSALALTAALGVVVLVSAAPARADDEHEVRAARAACRQIAKNRDWKDTDTDVRREGDHWIVIEVRGERRGEDRERRCVYNPRTGEARFDDQY